MATFDITVSTRTKDQDNNHRVDNQGTNSGSKYTKIKDEVCVRLRKTILQVA